MNIIWKKSPNFDKGRQGTKITHIVMHWIVGDLSAADAQFAKSSSQVSAHYAVGTSEVHQYVKEEDTAWHAGKYDVNLKSIGIEHRGGPDLPIDEGTYKNSAELLKDICDRHLIPLDREHIILHKEVKATACPGNLDVDKIIKMARGEDCEKKIDELNERLIKALRERQEKDDKYEDTKKEFAEYQVRATKDYEVQQKTLAEMNLINLSLRNDKESILREKNAIQASFEASEGKRIVLEDAIEKLSKEKGKLVLERDDAVEKLSLGLYGFSWKERLLSLFKKG
jgi:N-acetyl-anhydromuramyl-L-alanine amidase AmpD